MNECKFNEEYNKEKKKNDIIKYNKNIVKY